jgi:inorganic pyrophosphatase
MTDAGRDRITGGDDGSDMDAASVTVAVETPGGSRNTYEMDHATVSIYLDRMPSRRPRHPADYGFIEGTLGEGGDPLDALVLIGEPTFWMPDPRATGGSLRDEG